MYVAQAAFGKVALTHRPANNLEEHQPKSSRTTCELHALESLQLNSGLATIFALCKGTAPAERAFAFAKGLIDKISADLVLVEASLPVCLFHHP